MRLTRKLEVALVCIAVPMAGCGGPSGQPVRSESESHHPTETNGWWEAPLLTEPQYRSKVVVAEQKGRGDRTLPAIFSNGKDPVRVVVACSGGGYLAVLINSVDNGSRAMCDQIRTFIDVYTEAGEQSIAIRSGPDIRWKAAVIREDG
jgi:hypothetical protein